LSAAARGNKQGFERAKSASAGHAKRAAVTEHPTDYSDGLAGLPMAENPSPLVSAASDKLHARS